MHIVNKNEKLDERGSNFEDRINYYIIETKALKSFLSYETILNFVGHNNASRSIGWKVTLLSFNKHADQSAGGVEYVNFTFAEG